MSETPLSEEPQYTTTLDFKPKGVHITIDPAIKSTTSKFDANLRDFKFSPIKTSEATLKSLTMGKWSNRNVSIRIPLKDIRVTIEGDVEIEASIPGGFVEISGTGEWTEVTYVTPAGPLTPSFPHLNPSRQGLAENSETF